MRSGGEKLRAAGRSVTEAVATGYFIIAPVYCDKLSDKARGVPLAEAALRIFEATEDPAAAMVCEWLAKWKAEE